MARSVFRQGNVQFQYRTAVVAVNFHLDLVIADLNVLADDRKQFFLQFWQVVRLVALAPFVGNNDL